MPTLKLLTVLRFHMCYNYALLFKFLRLLFIIYLIVVLLCYCNVRFVYTSLLLF